MNITLKRSRFVWILGLIVVAFGGLLQASPPPGTYELYNGEGQRTGIIVSKLTTVGAISTLSVETKIEIASVVKTYHFTETESVVLSSSGVVSFRRDTDEEGKKTHIEGERAGKNLVVRSDRNGVKMATPFLLSTFDLTEFEMDLPASVFRQLKPNQSKTQRVLFFDRMAVVPVSRNIGAPQKLPSNDGEAPVSIMNTVIQGKPTTSWFHATSGDLLQEEGPDYLMTRVHP